MKTIAMTPCPELGYDPLVSIRVGIKRHTLRKRPLHGEHEVTVGRRRTGIVLRFYRHCTLWRDQFLTQAFAEADGLPSAEALRQLLEGFYGAVPETMVCNWFEVVQSPLLFSGR